MAVRFLTEVAADTTQKVKLPYSVEADTSQRVFIQQINAYDVLANCILIASVLADTEQPVYLPRTFQSDIQLAVRFLTEVAADATQRVFFERLTRFNVLVKSWMPIDIGADAKYEVRALIRLPENSFLFGSNVYNYKVYNQRSWGINKKFLADTEQKIYLLKRTDIDTIQVSYYKRQYFADTQQALKLPRLIAADFKLASYLKTQSRFDIEINAVFFTYKKDPYQGARDVSSLVYSRFIDDDIDTFLAPDKVSARLKRASVRVKNISPAVYIKRRDSNK